MHECVCVCVLYRVKHCVGIGFDVSGLYSERMQIIIYVFLTQCICVIVIIINAIFRVTVHSVCRVSHFKNRRGHEGAEV